MLFLALTAAYINIFFRFIKFYEIVITDPLQPRKFLYQVFKLICKFLYARIILHSKFRVAGLRCFPVSFLRLFPNQAVVLRLFLWITMSQRNSRHRMTFYMKNNKPRNLLKRKQLWKRLKRLSAWWKFPLWRIKLPIPKVIIYLVKFQKVPTFRAMLFDDCHLCFDLIFLLSYFRLNDTVVISRFPALFLFRCYRYLSEMKTICKLTRDSSFVCNRDVICVS